MPPPLNTAKAFFAEQSVQIYPMCSNAIIALLSNPCKAKVSHVEKPCCVLQTIYQFGGEKPNIHFPIFHGGEMTLFCLQQRGSISHFMREGAQMQLLMIYHGPLVLLKSVRYIHRITPHHYAFYLLGIQ